MEEQSSPKTFIVKKAAEDGQRVLNYAKGKPRRWKRLAKRIVVAGVLIGLGVGGWRYGPHVYLFARQRYWQRACMNFEAPPDTVVYERLPAGSKKPATAWPYMDADNLGFPPLQDFFPYWTSGGPEALPNPCVSVHRAPVCWVRFLKSAGDTTSNNLPTAVVFCHQRISPGGHERLVTVEFPAPYLGGYKEHPALLCEGLALEMSAMTYAKGQWDGCPPPVQYYFDGNPYPEQMSPMPQRVFAGQPDPADASHFTIEYEWPNKVRGVIDGRLRDDDFVELAERPGPGDMQHIHDAAYDNPALWFEWSWNYAVKSGN